MSDVREVQERRRSSAATPYSKSQPLSDAAAIAEQVKDMLNLDEDEIKCGSAYCTKDGCFNAQGEPI